MYLNELNNRPLVLNTTEQWISNEEVETTVDSIKGKLNGVNFDKFKGTPSHLEELLNKGYNLGIVVNTALDNTTHNYEKKSYLELYQSVNNTIRVYFGVEKDQDGIGDKLFIYSGKVKQEVSPTSQSNLYNHFFQKVNMYKNK